MIPLINNYAKFQQEYAQKDDPVLKEAFANECEEVDLDCSVCFASPFDNPYVIKLCHHVFCRVCIEKLEKKNCPLCRGKFTMESTAPAKDKQECIIKIWNRCSKGQQPEESLDIEKVTLIKLDTSEVEELVTAQEKLKYGQMMQSIFSALTDDQSSAIPGRPTFKTTWSVEQKTKYEYLREIWNACNREAAPTLSTYIDSLENIAFGLAEITKIQNSNLKICGGRKNAPQEFRSKGLKITIAGGDSEMVKEFLKLREGEELHTYVDGVEVRHSDSSFVRALTIIDDLLIDCFAKRYARGEFSKTFIALAKVSSESTEKQHDALISLCDYCSKLLQEDNLQVLLESYNLLALEQGGITLLGKLTENLICHDRSYKGKIQVILASLDENSISSLKKHVLIDIKESRESSLKLLFMCEEHKEWCTRQLNAVIENHIKEGQTKQATRLIDKYLIKQQKQEEAMILIRRIISKNIKDGYNTTASEVIDKYLLNNPVTRDEGMNFIRAIIQKNIKDGYNTTASEFIDKYLLNNSVTREEGMNFIHIIIQKNIKDGYNTTASEFIDKYMLNNSVTREEGMNFIRTIILKNIKDGYNSTASEFVDKYLFNNPVTREEGLNYIRTLISKCEKNGYKSDAAKFKSKYHL